MSRYHHPVLRVWPFCRAVLSPFFLYDTPSFCSVLLSVCSVFCLNMFPCHSINRSILSQEFFFGLEANCPPLESRIPSLPRFSSVCSVSFSPWLSAADSVLWINRVALLCDQPGWIVLRQLATWIVGAPCFLQGDSVFFNEGIRLLSLCVSLE